MEEEQIKKWNEKDIKEVKGILYWGLFVYIASVIGIIIEPHMGFIVTGFFGSIMVISSIIARGFDRTNLQNKIIIDLLRKSINKRK